MVRKDTPDDYVELDGVLVHKATIRAAVYFRRIDVVTTLHLAEIPFTSAIRCNRRPNHKPCPGKLQILSCDDEKYAWACSHCSFGGEVYGWRGADSDKSCIVEKINPADVMRVYVSQEDYEVLKDVPVITDEAEAVILGAVSVSGGVELSGCFEDFDDLADYLTAAISFTTNRKKRILTHILDEIEEMIAG